MSLTRLIREVPEIGDSLAALVDPNTDIHLTLGEFTESLPLESWSALSTQLPIQAPAYSDHYSLVGTAFDYLMRFQIGRANRKTVEETWVADHAVDLMQLVVRASDPELFEEAVIAVAIKMLDDYRKALERSKRTIRKFRTAKGEWVSLDESIRSEIISAALTMAKIDTYYRTQTVEPLLDRHDDRDVIDLGNLVQIAPMKALGAVDNGVVPWVNPSFGSISKLFNGADADLIVGDVLVDFKATKSLVFEKYFAQIIGYSIISERYRSERSDFPILNRAGIFFARHGLLATFDLTPVRKHPEYQKVATNLFRIATERHKEGTGFV